MKIEDIKVGMKVKISNVHKYVADGLCSTWYNTTGVTAHDSVQVQNCLVTFWVPVSDLTPCEEQHVGSITADIHFDMQAFKHDVLEYITSMDLTKYISANQGT